MGSAADWCTFCHRNHDGECPPKRLARTQKEKSFQKHENDFWIEYLNILVDELKAKGYPAEIRDTHIEISYHQLRNKNFRNLYRVPKKAPKYGKLL